VDRDVIDISEARRRRKKGDPPSTDESEAVNLSVTVAGADEISMRLGGSSWSMTLQNAKLTVQNFQRAIRSARLLAKPKCPHCGAHGCQRMHVGQKWTRKSDGNLATVESIFGKKIQLRHATGRISTVTGEWRLRQRYRHPLEPKR
jgi:hypothetical protein